MTSRISSVKKFEIAPMNQSSGNATFSYVNGNPGSQTGRAIGKTRYFSASADGGTLYFPSNHVSKFANQWIIEQQIHFHFINKNYKISEIPIPTVYTFSQISKLPPINYVFSVVTNTFRFSFLKIFS